MLKFECAAVAHGVGIRIRPDSQIMAPPPSLDHPAHGHALPHPVPPSLSSLPAFQKRPHVAVQWGGGQLAAILSMPGPMQLPVLAQHAFLEYAFWIDTRGRGLDGTDILRLVDCLLGPDRNFFLLFGMGVEGLFVCFTILDCSKVGEEVLAR